ncbi:hypothetical protein GE21DRAFT_179 [Neurospora crassa]|uniref:Uncharacterized protein n=1 Tax=Neurospora crassa (strain ATCC 24698 / 74-OR23-1A / CBS 708.71 / DSM 1257 / FGSC 987) TaxID=367110 RepID=Q7SF23_NEUCR|nr:hypothetical protein NCU07429 [Neurospora crassa OR74A]EAA35380.1 hypothetical protein NCU07429 [Neurospora crassa OR74A]KHE80766.1 hypothetical protein GE21DRAFT_179 [Neurospora crassa]|eukprot:XP_964616.1 hypothetical protein NCU07429 [Neurospora crassa OR74A]
MSDNLRTDLQELYKEISNRFLLFDSFFELKPSDSTDMGNHKWKYEWKECERLSERFQDWATTYSPWMAGERLYDATENLCIGIKHPTWSSNSQWTVADLPSISWKDKFPDESGENDSDSSSDDGKQRWPTRAIPPEERTEGDIKKQYVRLLLKIAHQVYECERSQFKLEDMPGLEAAHINDQEEKDPEREVYKPLCEEEDDSTIINSLFDSIRQTHVAAAPMPDWSKRLTELVPDEKPMSTDEPSQDPQG